MVFTRERSEPWRVQALSGRPRGWLPRGLPHVPVHALVTHSKDNRPVARATNSGFSRDIRRRISSIHSFRSMEIQFRFRFAPVRPSRQLILKSIPSGEAPSQGICSNPSQRGFTDAPTTPSKAVCAKWARPVPCCMQTPWKPRCPVQPAGRHGVERALDPPIPVPPPKELRPSWQSPSSAA